MEGTDGPEQVHQRVGACQGIEMSQARCFSSKGSLHCKEGKECKLQNCDPQLPRERNVPVDPGYMFTKLPLVWPIPIWPSSLKQQANNPALTFGSKSTNGTEKQRYVGYFLLANGFSALLDPAIIFLVTTMWYPEPNNFARQYSS
ncbi:hypothetical protein Scep_010611 [Stephania cephalantha]|uniref:Uncharacterized protein n=1 Tax=Stephania cephalantha TaxID=152367 RepID=A0AAP0JWE3_9MAGN